MSLFIALREGPFDKVKSILNHGVDLNLKGEEGNTCLHLAAAVSNLNEELDLILLKNPNLEIKNDFGETALMCALQSRNISAVEKLISKNANIQTEDTLENTPLHVAVECELESVVDLLLKLGADWKLHNCDGKNCLRLAIEVGFEPVVDKLLSVVGADLNSVHSRGSRGESCIEFALNYGNVSIARKLLDKGAFVSVSNLFNSLSYCEDSFFEHVVDYVLRADFDATCSRENMQLLVLAALRNNEKVVRKLLKVGFDVNIRTSYDETPLFYAVKHQSTRITKMLLEHGAEVNARDKSGCTALHEALSCYHVENARVLMNNGADQNAPSLLVGRSPLELSIVYTEGWYIPFLAIKSLMLNACKMNWAKLKVHLVHNDKKSLKYVLDYEHFKLACCKELERMKEIKFKRLSLYSVFSDLNNPTYAANKELGKYIKSYSVTKEFPQYATLLKRKLQEGQRRNSLMENIIFHVTTNKAKSNINIFLPKEISRKVLSYLTFSDIVNVIRAYGFSCSC